MSTVLVTGAGRGIGRAIAERLAAGGWSVWAGVRSEAAAQQLREGTDRITPIGLDITDDGQVAALDDVLPDRLDALVNNAGIGVLGPVETVPVADYRRQFEVNVFGQVAVTQAVLPRIRAANGRIVFITSTGGRAAVPMEGAYCASKFAVEGLADVLRVELSSWDIDVSVVEPGPTGTSVWQEIPGLLDDLEEGMSPDHRRLYSAHVAGLRRLTGSLQSRTTKPEVVARTVERALTARRPRARYAAGAQAKAMLAMSAVTPTRMGDAIGARLLGLPSATR